MTEVTTLNLVEFLIPQRESQQQKGVCLLSSGHLLLKCDRPLIPCFREKKKRFALCCQAELTHEFGHELQGVGEICEPAKYAYDVFIKPMQIKIPQNLSTEWFALVQDYGVTKIGEKRNA